MFILILIGKYNVIEYLNWRFLKALLQSMILSKNLSKSVVLNAKGNFWEPSYSNLKLKKRGIQIVLRWYHQQSTPPTG